MIRYHLYEEWSSWKSAKIEIRGASLSNANLGAVSLSNANLSNAVLANVSNATPEQLAQAKSLEPAAMPDGSIIGNTVGPDSFAGQVLAIWQKEGRLKRP